MAKKPKPFIIEDNTSDELLFPLDHGRGFDEKERTQQDGLIRKASFSDANGKIIIPMPKGADPQEIDIIPESEWDARFEEQEKYKSSLEHIRMRGDKGKPIKSYDQNGQGYCWFYSGTSALTMARARQNLPYVRFSAHAGAWVIKNGRDEGGWTGLAGPFIEERGIPTVKEWPEQSMNGRAYNTAETWEVAKKYRPTETWIDMRAAAYDRNLARRVLATLLFNNIPCTGDYPWWSHSVGLLRWFRAERGVWGPKCWNSWGDGWGELGMGVLTGSKAEHDGAIALRTPMAQAA